MGGEHTTVTYEVSGMTCGHCVAAVEGEVAKVAGVTAVRVDLETKRVTVQGDGVTSPSADTAIRAAIEEAGFEAA